ncbi:uncharacterized protein KZ484_023763 isoform 1-T1 [Pholidichthys leucotaenia]
MNDPNKQREMEINNYIQNIERSQVDKYLHEARYPLRKSTFYDVDQKWKMRVPSSVSSEKQQSPTVSYPTEVMMKVNSDLKMQPNNLAKHREKLDNLNKRREMLWKKYIHRTEESHQFHVDKYHREARDPLGKPALHKTFFR